eukprot:s268_g27.t1
MQHSVKDELVAPPDPNVSDVALSGVRKGNEMKPLETETSSSTTLKDEPVSEQTMVQPIPTIPTDAPFVETNDSVEKLHIDGGDSATMKPMELSVDDNLSLFGEGDGDTEQTVDQSQCMPSMPVPVNHGNSGRDSGGATVATLADANRYQADPEVLISDDVLVPHDSVHEPEHVLRALMHRMQVHTYSTAFSGVDSPGTAFAQLRAATGAALQAQGRTETAEFLRELMWAASRPGSRKASDTGIALVESDLEKDLDDAEIYENCLTEWEHKAYTKYIDQCPDGGLFSLNQNPDVRATFSKMGSAT